MSCHRRRAFTLVELMVVILMIAVMASVLVPAYNRFYAKSQFENTARQVQDIFAFAREQAIVRDTTVTVAYDAQNHAFLAQVAPPHPQTDLPVALVATDSPNGGATQSGESQKSYQLDPDVNLGAFTVSSGPSSASGTAGGGGNHLHFLSDGTVEGAMLTITSADGYSAQFQLWPATGRMTRMDAQP
jgi:prepilin-type N-terminal cleavage/methylation domain-containing protein